MQGNLWLINYMRVKISFLVFLICDEFGNKIIELPCPESTIKMKNSIYWDVNLTSNLELGNYLNTFE